MTSVPNWRMRTWLFFLVLGGTGVQWAIPQSAMAQQSCSFETLKGTYIYENRGFTLADGEHVPFSVAGFDYYNGDGTMTGVTSGSNNIRGSIVEDVEYTGTYKVNPDCTAELTTTVDVEPQRSFRADLFLAPDGNMVTFVQTDEGFVATGFEQRVSSEILRNSGSSEILQNSCSQANNPFLPGC
jgi:hypothetical protein